MAKELLEALIGEEREISLENHPTKANGYYTRDLFTLVGPVEDLKVPRVREGDFHLRILHTELRGAINWFWVNSVRHGEHADSVDLRKSRRSYHAD